MKLVSSPTIGKSSYDLDRPIWWFSRGAYKLAGPDHNETDQLLKRMSATLNEALFVEELDFVSISKNELLL